MGLPQYASSSSSEIVLVLLDDAYYPIRNGWKFWYGKNGLLYYKSIQDCQSYDLQNLGLKKTLRITRVEIIQHDAAGGVLDCFNSSEIGIAPISFYWFKVFFVLVAGSTCWQSIELLRLL